MGNNRKIKPKKKKKKINCPGGKQRSIVYHSICDTHCSQKEMFDELNIKKLLDSALIGYIMIIINYI